MMREEFELWRKDPVTQWVFAALARAAEQEKAEWIRQSWEEGKASPEQLLELRTRAFTLGEMQENGYEVWSRWNGEEIEE